MCTSGSQLKMIVSSRGHLAMSADVFGCLDEGDGGLWHLVGRAPGYCSMLYTAEANPPPRSMIPPRMSVELRLRNPGVKDEVSPSA